MLWAHSGIPGSPKQGLKAQLRVLLGQTQFPADRPPVAEDLSQVTNECARAANACSVGTLGLILDLEVHPQNQMIVSLTEGSIGPDQKGRPDSTVLGTLPFLNITTDHETSPSQASVVDVSKLLIVLCEAGKQVNTIKNYRSAIAASSGVSLTGQ